jgi:hypothetical protein
MAETFADSFAKGTESQCTESLLAQQDKQQASRQEFPPTLPELLIEETPFLYRKGKRRAMAGLEIVEGKEMHRDSVVVMREQLQHLQQLIYSWKRKNRGEIRKRMRQCPSASSAAKLNSLRTHPVERNLRATIGFYEHPEVTTS